MKKIPENKNVCIGQERPRRPRENGTKREPMFMDVAKPRKRRGGQSEEKTEQNKGVVGYTTRKSASQEDRYQLRYQ